MCQLKKCKVSGKGTLFSILGSLWNGSTSQHLTRQLELIRSAMWKMIVTEQFSASGTRYHGECAAKTTSLNPETTPWSR